jgi:beta-glucanase (GH16 family)
VSTFRTHSQFQFLGLVMLSVNVLTLPAQVKTGWDLVWSDEFNGVANTFPDPAKWNIEANGNPPNQEAQAYVKNLKNVSLNGSGQLELTALHEASGGKQYTSGRINSSGKFMRTYGRWEARIKLPAGTGFWPAFWMLGGNNGCGGWPSCGEIDIIENRGRLANVSSSAMHGPGYSGNTPITHAYTLKAGTADFFSSYHLFAVEWSDIQVRFYVDSALHYTVNKTDVQKYGNWVYNHDFYTILNLAVGGQFDGGQVPPSSAFPAKVMVDFVHVYQVGSGSLITGLGSLKPPSLTEGFAVKTVYDFMGRKREAKITSRFLPQWHLVSGFHK